MQPGATAAAVCCHYGTDPGAAGYGVNPGGGPLRVPATTAGGANKPKGILETLAAAIDNAVHGDSAGAAVTPSSGGTGYTGSGLNVVPFPMVNPFKSVVQSRVPVPGLTAHPRFTRMVRNPPSGEPDDEVSGMSGLGFTWGDFNPGFPSSPTYSEYPSSSPSKLQTVIGAIQATLPATIQAIRAQPSNIFPGTSYNPYATNAGGSYPGQVQAGANIGAQAGAAVGNVGDTIGNIVQQHPLLVLGGVAAVVLLMMNPPRRGR